MRLWVAPALLSVLLSLPAAAAPNDFRLNAQRNGAGILFTGNTPNIQSWERLTTELAYVLAPRLATPAETLGHAGFSTSLLWSGTVVSSDENYWFVTEAARDLGKPRGFLHTLQVDLRKGLPFSFEVGASVAWLVESELLAPALEVRWAPTEGFQNVPDVAFRGSVSHIVGNRDLNMTVVGLDGEVSKGFGIAGMVHLAPYLSWSVMMIAASSRVVDPTPTIETDFGENFVFPELVAGDNIHHKLTIGARALFYLLNVSFQAEFEMLEKSATGRSFFGSVATIGTKLGLDY